MAKNDDQAPPAAAAPKKPAASASKAKNETGPGKKTLWMGTAVGIGSAAIVAALLYTKRR
jgi:hypothetical protein